MLCISCCEDYSDCVMMPCGHGGLCYNCTVTILMNKNICHLCRLTVTNFFKVA